MKGYVDEKRLVKRWNKFLEIAPDDIGYATVSDETHYDKEVREQLYAKYWPKGISLVFMGCGSGFEVSEAIKLGYNAWGVNLGEDMQNLALSKFGLKILSQDMHFTSFSDNYFDGVGSFYSFEHSPAPLIALAEWYRVLKPKGRLIIKLPNTIEHVMSSSFASWRHPLVTTAEQTKMLGGMMGLNCLEVHSTSSDDYFIFEKPEHDNIPGDIKGFIYDT